MKKLLVSVALIGSFFCAAIFAQTPERVNLSNILAKPYPAPEILEINKWFNSEALRISDLRGKVVLVDFWTYSCINCIRTFPYLNKLHENYNKKGLIIIGVHSPEFEFEKRPENVAAALRQFKISYPVAMDNKMSTWKNYSNQYWPAHYLINKQGEVVYTHFGEGNYDILENNIRILLELEAEKIDPKKIQTVIKNQTPETYLGSDRSDRNFNDSLTNLTFPEYLPLDGWALRGSWRIDRQFVESKKAGDTIRLNFSAKKVFAVMRSEKNVPIEVQIFIDGKKAQQNAGSDVANGAITVKGSKLYELVNLEKNGQAMLEITAQAAGLQVYTLTFGDR